MNAQKESTSYLNEARALVSSPAPLAWATTLDHKRIGVLYLLASGLALIAAEVASAALQKDLAGATVLAFLFLIPSIPAALGSFFLPLQLGQKTSALPHASLLGLWLYVLGAVDIVGGIVTTDWAKPEATGLVPMLGGAVVLSLSAALSSVNLLATTGLAVLRGLPSSRVTSFVWSICATSIAQLLACVALVAGVTYLGLGHAGAPVGAFLSDFPAHVLAHPWADLAPVSTVMLVPAIGLVSDILASFAGKKPAGFGFVATSVSALAWLGLVTWAYPLFIGGDGDADAQLKLGLTTALLSVPLAVVAFSWLLTLHRGRISLAVPMLWALGCLFQVTLSAPGGLLLGLPPTSALLHGTLFETGFRHYVFVGVPIMGFFAGVHYFWPKMTGKLSDPRLGRATFALVFLGLQAAFLPEMIAGISPDASSSLAAVSTYGSYALAAGAVGALLVLVVSLFRGARASENPWGARGLEWTVASPPPLVNFAREPEASEDADDESASAAASSNRGGAASVS